MHLCNIRACIKIIASPAGGSHLPKPSRGGEHELSCMARDGCYQSLSSSLPSRCRVRPGVLSQRATQWQVTQENHLWFPRPGGPASFYSQDFCRDRSAGRGRDKCNFIFLNFRLIRKLKPMKYDKGENFKNKKTFPIQCKTVFSQDMSEFPV